MKTKNPNHMTDYEKQMTPLPGEMDPKDPLLRFKVMNIALRVRERLELCMKKMKQSQNQDITKKT